MIPNNQHTGETSMNTFIAVWLLLSLAGTVMFCLTARAMGKDSNRQKIKGNIHQ